jgi:hypothetical protein
MIKSINGVADFGNNPIESHVLGLLQIDNLKSVRLSNKKVEGIVNKYLSGSRDMFECMNELIDMDLEEYAQL